MGVAFLGEAQPWVTASCRFTIRVNTDHHQLMGKGLGACHVLVHLLFSVTVQTRMTNSKSQIQRSKAQRGETTGPSLRETVAEGQGEVCVSSTLPERAERQGAAPPTPVCPPPCMRNPSCPTRGFSSPSVEWERAGTAIHGSFWLHLFPTVKQMEEKQGWGGVSPSRAGRQTGSPGPPHTAVAAPQAMARRSSRSQASGETN